MDIDISDDEKLEIYQELIKFQPESEEHTRREFS